MNTFDGQKKARRTGLKSHRGCVLGSQGVTIHDTDHSPKVFLFWFHRPIPLICAADVHHTQALPEHD